jgi:hypothetical protein
MKKACSFGPYRRGRSARRFPPRSPMSACVTMRDWLWRCRTCSRTSACDETGHAPRCPATRAFLPGGKPIGKGGGAGTKARLGPQPRRGGRKQIGVTTVYDPTYLRIPYPGGDVPADRGVCTDVVIRAYRTAFRPAEARARRHGGRFLRLSKGLGHEGARSQYRPPPRA